jgi:hypothetical protein
MRSVCLVGALTTAAVIMLARAVAQSNPVRLLRLEKTISLPDVEGRIDHLSVDVKGERLFLAALGNNTVEVIDLKTAKRMNTIRGLEEPQGLLYVASTNRVYVANRKDGSLHIYDADSLKLVKSIPYGEDADNVRFDAAASHVFVGYRDGALGEIDLNGTRTGDIPLGAHPESFQLEKNGPRIFVNVPDSQRIVVIDRKTRSTVATWRTGGPQANYPMALDESNHRLFVVCRNPARFVAIDTDTGKIVASLSTVGDSDDVFLDEKRKRIYVIGGEGAVAVIAQSDPDHYREVERIRTRSGARTGFFSPDFDRLYVAIRKQGSQLAEVRVYAPQR